MARAYDGEMTTTSRHLRSAIAVFAAALAAGGGTPAGAADATGTPSAWKPDVEAARTFARSRPGQVSFSVTDLSTGKRWGEKAWRPVPGASLLKTLLLVAHLRRGDVRDRPLTKADRTLLDPMIRRSANAPASVLARRLGADRVRRAGLAAGMGRVELQMPWWGLTRTTARAQAKLFGNLPAVIPKRHRAYAMRLLSTVTPSQRWGIGAVDLPGWTVHLKGGWGSGSGAVDHQSALLVRGDQRIAVAITTTGSASHQRGKATLRGVAIRLLRTLPVDAAG